MSRKTPTPIRIAPSSAPLEAMVAKQQSNIDELVTRNRSLEQSINKLKAELSAEKAKSDATAQQLHQQHKAEQGEWREGCDSLQSLWRIAHLKAVVDLEKERTVAFKLKEDLRSERLARLQRDFQIGQFQAREAELEDRVQELTLDNGERNGQTQEELAALETTVQEQQREADERKEELEEAIQSKKQLEKALAGLRKEHTSLLASSSSSSADLERTNLQVEGLKSSLAELQGRYNDIQVQNADLLRQLEKWRNIENREGGELETIRKRKIELEIQVKEQEERLAEAEEAQTLLKTKYQTRIQQYKVSLNDHASALDDANNELDEREREIEEFKLQLAEAEETIAGLGFKASRSTVAASPKQKRKPQVDDLDDEIQEINGHAPRPPSLPYSPIAKSTNKPRPRPVKKAPQAIDRGGSDSDIELVGEPSRPQKAPDPFNFDFGDLGGDDEIEETVPSKKDKGKGKAIVNSAPPKKPRGRPKKQKSQSPEPEDIPVEAPNSPGRGKGKRKANSVNDGAVDDALPKKRGKKVVADSDSGDVPLSKPASKKNVVKPPPKTKGKAREASLTRDANSDSGEVAVVQKKKKRKINVFSKSDAPAAFDFRSFSNGTDGGLNIPLELSPVKPGEQAPSLLGKALSGLGGSGSRR
ncbi:uncharacterized protein PHACADRAFT_117064 [Phanerochaete carnosa HHB-10118-sp]|uniref:Uncharacterized protein n=1 Tax=Phanerochaete carnosa (strain HHB-10118-sp) TaxID=650164 RepID=K5WG26_PHACS|nr:uncharacterized protein PHACADRAFT_117064 [Phanerochaete carnosa HHB-10118-sp]EKM58265.1 hypothetical protein PHACADRAFT_117064 [Phanerochaete carnosa HHB-10118-sp]